MFAGENRSENLLAREKPGVLSFGGARMALLDIEVGFWGLRRQLEVLAGRRLADSVLHQAGANSGASFVRSWIGHQANKDPVRVLRVFVRHLADAFQGRAGIPVQLVIEGQCEIPPQVKVAMYCIAQETLNSVDKHSNAEEALLQVTCEEQRVEVLIADNGEGFDPCQVPPDHLGLGIMKERADDVGVELEINSAIGKGTRVSLVWTS